jgi:hypothetical protein
MTALESLLASRRDFAGLPADAGIPRSGAQVTLHVSTLPTRGPTVDSGTGNDTSMLDKVQGCEGVLCDVQSNPRLGGLVPELARIVEEMNKWFQSGVWIESQHECLLVSFERFEVAKLAQSFDANLSPLHVVPSKCRCHESTYTQYSGCVPSF